MIKTNEFYNELFKNEFRFYTGVPDSTLKEYLNYLEDNLELGSHIIAANEGNAIGIAAGYYLSTKKTPVVYMQNSGIGNALNPIVSMLDTEVYNIPILLIVGWRGQPGKKDEPQHIKQGKITEELLDIMDIKYEVLDRNKNIYSQQILEAKDYIKETSKSYCLLIEEDTFQKYSFGIEERRELDLGREEAIGIIIDNIDTEGTIIGTTGKISREIFEYRIKTQENHKDFLTVGSMGHASSIALGVALNSTKKVYCLDGDGSIIMHMGSLAVIGSMQNLEITHIVLNNGAHDSVGGHRTVGFEIDIKEIAKNSGYDIAISVSNKYELEKSLKKYKDFSGKVFIEVFVNKGARKNLGRPTKTPKESKLEFISWLED